jgi:hypothetical protein
MKSVPAVAAASGFTDNGVVLGLVDHLPGLRHLDHPGLAEGAPQEILNQALHAFLVTRLQPDALVHAEPRVLPGAHVRDDVFGDLALGQEQREDLLLPELEKRLGPQLGQREKCAACLCVAARRQVRQEHTLAHQGVNVRMRALV